MATFYDLLTGLTYFDYPFEQVVAPLAALLLARWMAFEEEERKAIASFDDLRFEPALPAELQEWAWSPRHGAQILEALATGDEASAGSFGSPAWRLSRLVKPT